MFYEYETNDDNVAVTMADYNNGRIDYWNFDTDYDSYIESRRHP